jgi:hypothetical protein
MIVLANLKIDQGSLIFSFYNTAYSYVFSSSW